MEVSRLRDVYRDEFRMELGLYSSGLCSQSASLHHHDSYFPLSRSALHQLDDAAWSHRW